MPFEDQTLKKDGVAGTVRIIDKVNRLKIGPATA